MKSLLLDYGFNIMEYKVLDNQKDHFIVLSLITGNTYKVEKEVLHGTVTTHRIN